jgi:hypothetical protein
MGKRNKKINYLRMSQISFRETNESRKRPIRVMKISNPYIEKAFEKVNTGEIPDYILNPPDEVILSLYYDYLSNAVWKMLSFRE